MAATLTACTDGTGPASGRLAPLDLRPTFQVDPSLFPAGPIDRIRLVAYEAQRLARVGASDTEVSPTADSWTLELGIEMGDAASLQVVVEAELLSSGAVEWSGRLGPFTVTAGAAAVVRPIAVHRGPLENLDVVSLGIVSPPTQLPVGATATLSAQLQLTSGSSASPVVYWASTNPLVATVTPVGTTATLTPISQGTVQIIASSGEAYDEFTLQVGALPAGSKLWVGGVSSAPSDWHTAGNWSPAGVPGTNDDVLLPSSSSVTLSQDGAAGSVTMTGVATLDLSSHTLSIRGNLAAPYVITNGLVAIVGTGSLLEGFLPDVRIDSDRLLSGTLSTTGSLTLNDADLDLNDQVLYVEGSLLVAGANAHLVMNDVSSGAYVTGEARFEGGDHTNLLTEGALGVGGDFFVSDVSPAAFAASGNHVTYLQGSLPQTVTFLAPGPGQQHFHDLVITNSAGVTFQSSAEVSEFATVFGRMSVPGGSTVSIGATLTLYVGSQVQVDGTISAKDCSNLGGTITGTGSQPCGPPAQADRIWQGGGAGDPSAWSNGANWVPAGVPTAGESVLILLTADAPKLTANQSVTGLTTALGTLLDLGGFTLTVSGDASSDGTIVNGLVDLTGDANSVRGFFPDVQVRSLRFVAGASTFQVEGNLTVEAALDVGAGTVYVQGNLDVRTANGVLLMEDPSGYVGIAGDAAFDGASLDGYLTAGDLYLQGDLTAGSTYSPTSFRSTGTHLVYLDGGTDQRISLANAGLAQQAFNDLYVVKSGGSVLVESDLWVAGALYAIGSTFKQAGAATVQARDLLFVQQVAFDGVPLRIVSSVPPDKHVMTGATFVNIDPTAVQLYIGLPGAGLNVPFALASPVFAGPVPSGGGYYIETFNTAGAELSVNVTSPTPVNRPLELKPGANTVIVW